MNDSSKRLTVALLGNPNSGKTTLFNHLAGAREKVGNWPGTTVEKKEAQVNWEGKEILFIDLPGIYNLNPSSLDEEVARDYLFTQDPDLVVFVADASNLERNLYLLSEILEAGTPVILVLNMMDLALKQGLKIDEAGMASFLKIPVVSCIASRKEGVLKLRELIIQGRLKDPVPLHVNYETLEEDIARMQNLCREKCKKPSKPLRFLAVKTLERNEGIVSLFCKDCKPDKNPTPETEALIIENRYGFIRGLLKECASKTMTIEERLTLSDKIDRVVTHPFLGLPIFLLLLYALFTSIFTVGEPLVHGLEHVFLFLGKQAYTFMTALHFPAWSASLVSEGIIPGTGSVICFLPFILLLFFGISILEDSGYLARSSFIMDRFMHLLGLHGKSFIPMLLGFGCNIPGIMAARTLDSHKDRVLTILIIPLMSCSARLPVYTLFAGAFFPGHQGLAVFSLYLLGVFLSIVMAKFFKTVFFKGEDLPLVMELPPYRIPILKNILIHMWLRAWLFIRKAGTVIVFVVIGIWILASLPLGVPYASEQSLIGMIGKVLAPVFAPAGFGFWQAAVALILGIAAKENVVGTLGTLYGVRQESLSTALMHDFTPLSAYAFLVMTLVYIPCAAAIGTIKREAGWKWAVVAVSYTLVLGWILSVLVFQLGRLF